MKNIWILNHYASESGGRHYKFAENLIKLGFRVKIYAASTVHNTSKNRITNSNKYLYEVHDDIPFIFIKACNYVGNDKKRIKNMLDYAMGLILVSKKFDKEKPHIIYASSVHPLTWIAGYWLAKRYDAKFIAETRDLWPETLVAMGRIKRYAILAMILYKLEKFIYKKADKLIFTMPGGKDYVEKIGINTAKVRYINNGVDLEEYNTNKLKYDYSDIDLDNQEKFKVVYTGSMGVANALEDLINTAEILQDKRFNKIQFLLFGEGYQKNKLEQYVSINNINNVIFKGKVEKKYIPTILSKSDLNIFTGKKIYLYRYGISLNKMFDYFASGKPIVSNVECGYDMLEKYNCGITVKGGCTEDLAEAILNFYNMPKEEYYTYCNNSLKAAQDFDFKILTNKLEEVFLEE